MTTDEFGPFKNKETLEAAYDEFLNEIYKPYELGVLTFYPDEIIRRLDPIVYDIGMQEFLDNIVNGE